VLDLSKQKRVEAEIRALKEQLYKRNLGLRDEVDRASMFEEIVGTSKPGEPWNEREIIEAALAKTRGLVSGALGAAAKLGISPSTLDHSNQSLENQEEPV
jgi:transcriptional regulator with GAF, ATPase, and Fis domain